MRRDRKAKVLRTKRQVMFNDLQVLLRQFDRDHDEERLCLALDLHASVQLNKAGLPLKTPALAMAAAEAGHPVKMFRLSDHPDFVSKWPDVPPSLR